MRGTGTISHLCYVMSHTEIGNESRIWSLTSLVILLAMILQGFTIGRAMRTIENDNTVTMCEGRMPRAAPVF